MRRKRRTVVTLLSGVVGSRHGKHDLDRVGKTLPTGRFAFTIADPRRDALSATAGAFQVSSTTRRRARLTSIEGPGRNFARSPTKDVRSSPDLPECSSRRGSSESSRARHSAKCGAMERTGGYLFARCAGCRRVATSTLSTCRLRKGIRGQARAMSPTHIPHIICL